MKESEKKSIFNDRKAADEKESNKNKEKTEVKREEIKAKEARIQEKQTEKTVQSEKEAVNPKKKEKKPVKQSQEGAGKRKRVQTKKKEKKPTSRQHEIKVAGAILVSLLGAMLLYFVYFEVKGKDEVLASKYNTRQQNMAQLIRKGDIMTSDGVVVATTQTLEDGTEVRTYPYSNWYAHTVGYSVLGGYGLEDTQKLNLLTSHIDFWTKLKNEFLGVKTQGDTLVTTLDSGLQDFCYRQLDGNSGSITVVEPSTGKILAMVSSPNFDPNTVEEQWSWLTSDENTTQNLMNHATQGTYPPGSTFKIITLLEYIRENPDTWQDFHYTCTGTYTNGDYVVNCHDGVAHGELDIYGILGMSCNGAFDTIAQTLDSKKWQKLAEDFGYNQSDRSQVDFPYQTSSFDIASDDSVWQRMQLAIGQGSTNVTPLLNLMMYAAVANNGVMMTPYLVDSYLDADGNLVEQTKPKALRTVCTQEEAELLDEFLTYVITNGTAAAGGSQYARVSGKTGSAQYDSTKNYHAWFCGYGTNDEREIAVCVMIEKGGAGGSVAAPIAGQIFDYFFSR